MSAAKENGIISLPDESLNADLYTAEQYRKMLSEQSVVQKSKDMRSLPSEEKENSISDFVLEDGTLD